MTLPTKTRLAKRKLEIQEVRKEKQTTTSKKHDKKCLQKKPEIDSEYINLKNNFDSLQKKYDALTVENDQNNDRIHALEQTVKHLESKKDIKLVVKKNMSTQSDTLDLMFCSECEYPAETIFELGEHMFEFHSEEYAKKIACHYCDETFETKDGVMKHRKISHLEKVKTCIFYSEGKCEHGDECWFNHDTKARDNQTDETVRLKCRLCDKTFNIRSDFMNHRKHEHSELTEHCRNDLNGCPYAPYSCWFKHAETENTDRSQNIKNHSLTEKLFNMMEKIVERLADLENKTREQHISK